jgi:hypothetical protein
MAIRGAVSNPSPRMLSLPSTEEKAENDTKSGYRDRFI